MTNPDRITKLETRIEELVRDFTDVSSKWQTALRDLAAAQGQVAALVDVLTLVHNSPWDAASWRIKVRDALVSTSSAAAAHDRRVRRQAFDNLPAAIDEWARDRWSKGQLLPKWDDWKAWLRARADAEEKR